MELMLPDFLRLPTPLRSRFPRCDTLRTMRPSCANGDLGAGGAVLSSLSFSNAGSFFTLGRAGVLGLLSFVSGDDDADSGSKCVCFTGDGTAI